MTRESQLAALSYVGVLVFIPIIAQQTKKPLVAFHVWRGLIILGCEIGSIILAHYLPRVGSVLFLLFFLASIIGFFFAIQGKTYA